MKFINVRLLVSNFPASLKFWRDIMKLSLTYGSEEMEYAYFDTGSAGIELMGREAFAAALDEPASAQQSGDRPAVLVFLVDDVDASFTELVEQGAKPIAGPQDRPAWGARSAHIGDPDGYLVEIYSKLAPAESAEA